MLTGTERVELLRLARAAVESAVRAEPSPSLPSTPIVQQRLGAFVTLTLDADLRGCIGYPEADRTLGEVILRCAEGASQRDPRFPPVSVQELPGLHIELSILGPLELVTDLADIDVGRHGLVVQQNGRRGLLLPQVATERGWDRDTFLQQTCVKAGLPAQAWRTGGVQVFRFAAEVFGE